MTRNSHLLQSFTDYCNNHPDERFWQALRNWSKFGFIFGFPIGKLPTREFDKNLIDTFYLEDQDG